jgi:hypothetical protein
LPLLAYDLGNLWVGKSRMMGYDGLLMVLPVKDERYKESATVNKLHHSVKQRNLCQEQGVLLSYIASGQRADKTHHFSDVESLAQADKDRYALKNPQNP